MESKTNNTIINGSLANEKSNVIAPGSGVKKVWVKPFFEVVSGNKIIKSGPLAGGEGSGSAYYS